MSMKCLMNGLEVNYPCSPVCALFGDCVSVYSNLQMSEENQSISNKSSNEWISVEERLPENSANVLVCHENGYVTTNAWLIGCWWFKNERNPITHWMPLPEPPKEK